MTKPEPIKSWERGDTVYHPNDLGEAKVMAVADGYIMARRPRGSPFVISFRTATETYLRKCVK